VSLAVVPPGVIHALRLTDRELECLAHASNGHTARQTGILEGLSEKTIKSYLGAARRKLGAVSTTHAVAIAIREGLL